ncbi:hypothetical protein EVAR_29219_1 [Eumeta japonica]|uniref:Uncharacterized protein n=1 Tax=Eumeta variegata TaxID=151549 RepID=A0A4C1VKM2_EUMVA|nr:hypothetical protein EVAR_29219_1 [Eumeta japonica]
MVPKANKVYVLSNGLEESDEKFVHSTPRFTRPVAVTCRSSSNGFRAGTWSDKNNEWWNFEVRQVVSEKKAWLDLLSTKANHSARKNILKDKLKDAEKEKNAVEMRSLRSICGVSRKDRRKNSDLRERCGLKEDVVTRVERESCLNWTLIRSEVRSSSKSNLETRIRRAPSYGSPFRHHKSWPGLLSVTKHSSVTGGYLSPLVGPTIAEYGFNVE